MPASLARGAERSLVYRGERRRRGGGQSSVLIKPKPVGAIIAFRA